MVIAVKKVNFLVFVVLLMGRDNVDEGGVNWLSVKAHQVVILLQVQMYLKNEYLYINTKTGSKNVLNLSIE